MIKEEKCFYPSDTTVCSFIIRHLTEILERVSYAPLSFIILWLSHSPWDFIKPLLISLPLCVKSLCSVASTEIASYPDFLLVHNTASLEAVLCHCPCSMTSANDLLALKFLLRGVAFLNKTFERNKVYINTYFLFLIKMCIGHIY